MTTDTVMELDTDNAAVLLEIQKIANTKNVPLNADVLVKDYVTKEELEDIFERLDLSRTSEMFWKWKKVIFAEGH